MALPSKTAPLEMDIAVIAYKASRVTGGAVGRGSPGSRDYTNGVQLKKRGQIDPGFYSLSLLLVRPPNPALEGNRHVRGIRQRR